MRAVRTKRINFLWCAGGGPLFAVYPALNLKYSSLLLRITSTAINQSLALNMSKVHVQDTCCSSLRKLKLLYTFCTTQPVLHYSYHVSGSESFSSMRRLRMLSTSFTWGATSSSSLTHANLNSYVGCSSYFSLSIASSYSSSSPSPSSSPMSTSVLAGFSGGFSQLNPFPAFSVQLFYPFPALSDVPGAVS